MANTAQCLSFDEKISREYFKKDPDLSKKTLTYYGLIIASVILQILPLIGVVLGLIINSIIFGYFANLAHSRILKRENKLNDWTDYKKLFVTGIQGLLGCFIIFLPAYIIWAIVLISLSITNNKQGIAIFMLTVIILPIILILSVYFFAAQAVFISNLKLSSFFILKQLNTL